MFRAAPVYSPERTKPLRDGLTFIFPELRAVVANSGPGYNGRDIAGNLWIKIKGWLGTPSRHSYTAAFDVMLNQLKNLDGTPYSYLDAVRVGDKVAAWAVQVATEERYANANRAYGGIVEVIWNRRIWTKSKGWHDYSGASQHLEHVHIGLHCPEMADPK